MRRIAFALLMLALLPVGVSAQATAVPRGKEGIALRPYKLPLDWKHFYSYDETVATLKKFASAFPDLCRIETIGRSYRGNDLWMIEIGNPRTGPRDKKPAMYVDGNIHGNETQGTEICLYIAWTLLNRYGQDRYVTGLLDTRTFYIVPSVNPDARIDFFKNPQTPNSQRGNYRPKDNDQDGLFDEDAPEDIDGDGHLLSMRKRDPFGRWKLGSDPRLLVPVEFGEKGEWTTLGLEGRDKDGDGQVGEDGPGGVDLNRNFAAGWKPPHEQFGAGDYPFSEPEIRAVGLFLYTRKNIAAVQSFHNAGNMILYPPGGESERNLSPRDAQVYRAVGRRGEKLLPGYRSMNVHDGLYPASGSTLDWAYYACGAMGFTNEIWGLPREFATPAPAQPDPSGGFGQSQADQLRFLDILTHGEGFIAYKPFKHPVFGDIEIGGYDQFSTRIPPIDYLEDICQRNTQFVLFHAEAMPLLKIHDVRVAPAGTNVWRVEATVANTGYMDTMPEATRQSGAYKPVIAQITVPGGVTVVEGAERGEYSGVVDQTAEVRPGLRRRNEARVDLGTIQGGSKKIVQWLVVTPNGGAPRVTLRVRGQKAGEETREITLK